MTKIYFYISSELNDFYNLIDKIFVANKKLKSFIFTKDYDFSVRVDKEMWTFSQNVFIPHLHINDTYNAENPILIGDFAHLESFDLKKVDNLIFLIKFDDLSVLKPKIIDFTSIYKDKDVIVFFYEEFDLLSKKETFNFLKEQEEIGKDVKFFLKENGKWNKVELK